MKNISLILSGLLFAATIGKVEAQGAFGNLDFEFARVSGYPPGTNNIPVTRAFPGWTAYYGSQIAGSTNASPSVWYASLSLGGAMIAIDDTNASVSFAPYAPLQGRFSAYVVGDAIPPQFNPSLSAIGQTGQIPGGVQSLVFWTASNPIFSAAYVPGFDVTFAGQLLSLTQIGSTASYDIMGANISAFAGQTGELLFTAAPNRGGILDNIQFSTSPIPEPGAFALLALGGLILGARCWRRV